MIKPSPTKLAALLLSSRVRELHATERAQVMTTGPAGTQRMKDEALDENAEGHLAASNARQPHGLCTAPESLGVKA